MKVEWAFVIIFDIYETGFFFLSSVDKLIAPLAFVVDVEINPT